MAETLVFEMEINAKMDKALEEVKEINEGTKEINDNLSAIKKSGKVAETGLKGIAKGFKGVGLAMKAAGIGLIIEAFNFLREIMMKNQRVVDGLEIAINTLSAVFNEVASVVVSFGETILGAFTKPQETLANLQQKFEDFKTYIKEKFSGVGMIISGIFSGNFGLVKVGIESLKEGITEMAEDVTEVLTDVAEKGKKAFDQSVAIQKLKNEVKLLEAEQTKLNFTYLKEQELQRQIRDDVSATFEERINANDELAKSLAKQFEDEKAIVMEKLRLARMESDANKENVDLKAEVINKEAELADLEERINGFRSEQIVNRVALEQEQADAINELRLATMTGQEQELEELKQQYEAKLELARKAGADTLEIDRIYEAEKTYILGEEERIRAKNQEAIDREQAKKDKKKAADDLKEAEALEKLKLDMQNKAYSMAKGLFAENEKAQKAFALAEIGIDTARAISSLTANSEANPGNALTFGGAGIIQFATGMLRIAANIKSAKKLLSSKGDATPDAPSDSAGGEQSTQSQRPSMVSNTPSGTQFDLSASTQQFQQQPIQAFVVQTDIQNQQENLTQIQDQATL